MESHERLESRQFGEHTIDGSNVDSECGPAAAEGELITTPHSQSADMDYWGVYWRRREAVRQQIAEEAAAQVDQKIDDLSRQILAERKLGRMQWVTEWLLAKMHLIDPDTVPKRHAASKLDAKAPN